ncbi:divalent-cation tolerance protein CutA [Aureimonas flava]|uniref:Divalent-cation tolerance protein CutA n=1 Tax=Aureimonas flava TaxID=2320271 RepID=A0A3A1WSQ4_9HYPH|nr:divalent-cation tolerance protein CutA [Aureimonas flava]RIY00735.1 divalent-cation tolerance protein CutA [Aureimonas flava]
MTQARALDIAVACPDEATARAIADGLLARRLVACAQLSGPIESRYRWKGALECAREVVLVLKTLDVRFEAVASAIRALHPYETPAITGSPVLADAPTLRWIADACIASATRMGGTEP